MENTPPKPVKLGYRYGLLLFIFGVVIITGNLAMVYFSDKYFPKLLTVGIAISILAPIFFIFPGGKFAQKPETKDLNKVFWKNAPGLHKAMWIIWGIISIVIAFFALISFDSGFLN